MNINFIKNNIHKISILLRATYSIGYLLAGLDKFFKIYFDWHSYLNTLSHSKYSLCINIIFYFSGFIEIFIGLLLLTKYVRKAAFLASLWLIIKAVYNIVIGQYYDIAARYLVVAIGSIALEYIIDIQDNLKK